MATLEQKIYLIGGQKVISTAISQNYMLSRRKSLFRPSGIMRAISRMLSQFSSKERTAPTRRQR